MKERPGAQAPGRSLVQARRQEVWGGGKASKAWLAKENCRPDELGTVAVQFHFSSMFGAAAMLVLWISESFGRHLPPLFSSPLTFLLGLRLAMIQRFFPKAQRVAVFGGG
jgi:hypothetical protein